MLFEQFIQQANLWGKERCPFFFLIDFEQKKPLIFPLESAVNSGVFFNVRGKTNVDEKTLPKMPLNLTALPMELEDYQQGFELVQQELQKGNSYLLNLTYPTEIKTNFSLLQFFEQTQASYKLYVKDQFVCFSPECFIRISDNQIATFPMKGTINAMLPDAEQRLLNEEKEQQEHYTIVDLMRNDLAMVASNIQVKRFRYVERIETAEGAILQTSSEIVGDLTSDWRKNIGTILAKMLPAGSISGAPKAKTVQIIRQAEGQERGYYTGIFGVFDGENLDSAVAIRFIEQQGDKLFFRSGGGITRQSRLQDEYQEMLQKVSIPLKDQGK